MNSLEIPSEMIQKARNGKITIMDGSIAETGEEMLMVIACGKESCDSVRACLDLRSETEIALSGASVTVRKIVPPQDGTGAIRPKR